MAYHWYEFAPGQGMYDEVVNKLNQPATIPSWADPMVNWEYIDPVLLQHLIMVL